MSGSENSQKKRNNYKLMVDPERIIRISVVHIAYTLSISVYCP